MSALLKKVENFLHKISFTPEQNILLACSGGRDSMVLAYALKLLDVNFALVHCNFRLRGKESDGDETLVKDWAETNAIKVYSTGFNTIQYAEEHKLNIQLAARELRYQYFRELLRKEKFNYLATAHHLQDSLETLLINIGRGTGFKGLIGIPEINEKIIRPLNKVNHKEILDFAQKHQIEWREDSSNQKDDYQRNAIRHHVIPGLQKAIPDFDTKWESSFNHLQSDWLFFEGQLKNKLKELVKQKNQRAILSIHDLLKIEGFPSLLHYWLLPYGNFDLTAIINSLTAESGKTFESATHRLLKDRDVLILEAKEKKETGSFFIDQDDDVIEKPLTLSFDLKDISTFELNPDQDIAALDVEKLQFPLSLRKWHKGDRFYPLGLNKPKKVSDFFIDHKIDRFTKEQTWLLCSNDQIVWIIGLRIDDRFKITDNTKTVYLARLLKRNPS